MLLSREEVSCCVSFAMEDSVRRTRSASRCLFAVHLRKEVCFRISSLRRGAFLCFFRHGRLMEKDRKREEVRVRCFFVYRGTSLIRKRPPP